ncbi:DUF2178 domain-containing protein [Methanomicrobium antiquum]|uniref:DUF2178 domain-containing protein n=1 Tax=Methanomicrobium antiquum TaxID=487686 RepID=A0AAF0FP21_9EURY|nr:DUF2178 domain-containing protein [Methanomicrobium antiquum]WFN37005.1 DUF2178 domain-containing protein [Methanomicrobium antiquum]
MKRNTFYAIVSLIAIAVALIFWWGVNYNRPPGMEVVTGSIIIAAFAIYLLRQKIDDAVISDEMISKINEKSALRSLQIFWVGFFAFTISGLSMAMGVDNPHMRDMMIKGSVSQLIFLASILLIYAIFRIYYSDKYGGYEADEESD